MVEHVAKHDAVLGHGKEGVDEGLTVLIVSPVEIESQTRAGHDDLGQDLLVLDRVSLVTTAYL